MNAAKLSHAETVNAARFISSLCKMHLLVCIYILFCSDDPRAQKHSSSDWLNLIFVCDQHECWPLPSWLIFASPRKFTERSWSSTDFLSVCVCLCVPVCAWGHLPGTEPMEGLALPTDRFCFMFAEIWTHLYQQQQSQTRQKGTSFFYLPSTFVGLTFHWQLLPI